MFSGYGVTHTNNAALLTEVSTLFLNYRSMYPKDRITETIPQINQLLFFITYTVFRVFFFPPATRMLISHTWYTWGRISTTRTVLAIITTLFFLAMWVLNMFWYMLVLKGLFRMLGITKPSKKKGEKGDKTKVQDKQD